MNENQFVKQIILALKNLEAKGYVTKDLIKELEECNVTPTP